MTPLSIRLLVCGGRDYSNEARLYKYLDEYYQDQLTYGFRIQLVITGVADDAQSGADFLADQWAVSRRIQPVRCPALWTDEPLGWGKAAGPIRNSAMALLRPDKAVAFPGGSGTADMIRKLKNVHIPVIQLAH